MSTLFDFDDIRPFYDHEAQDALQRMKRDPLFMKLINYLWPEMQENEINSKAKKVNSSIAFQREFMDNAIRTIVERSAVGLSHSGFENIDPNKKYLFIANHRDILLDSAILQVLLLQNGHDTSEITFGNNLMENAFITDFGRINRMFTVQREGTSRELYDISKKLSAYIRHTIINKKISVWIAQGNGRTKDGNDQTQTGLLKMLNISGNGNFGENFSQLNIVPLTISYEYEPCDSLKVRELYLSSLHTKYVKAQGEDLNSIVSGIVQQKGYIHLAVGKPVVEELNEIDKSLNDNEKIKQLKAIIDKQIHEDYKLWPVNYIAFDILQNCSVYNHHYSQTEKQDFINYINNKIAKFDGEKDTMFSLFVKMYATPLKNKITQTVIV